MSTTFHHPKRKTFYHRSHIPLKLRQHFKGRVEFWRSLKTTDKDEAALRAAQWDARIRKVFLKLKREGQRMTQDEIDALVDYWLDNELGYAEDCRSLAGPMSDAARESQLDGLDIMHEQAYESLLGNDHRRIKKDADELLKAAGLPALDHAGAEFGRLCRRLLQARIEYTRIEANRWNGNEPYKRVNHGASQVTAQLAVPTVKLSLLFSEVVELYSKENARAPRTDSQVRAEFEKFLTAIGGDRPNGTISKEQTRAYKESILHTRKLTLSTCVKHLSNLSVLFKWAEAQGFIPENSNPCRGLAPSKKQAKKQATKRSPFTDEELLTVFSSPEFLKQKDTNPARYWLPLLCLFSAARREEIG